MPNHSTTKQVKIGNVRIGAGNIIAVQSMTKTDTSNVKATINQIKALENAGCEIIRSAIPDMTAAKAIKKIKKSIKIPFVADIHFDYRLALESIRQGADKIRINPGNIGANNKVKEIVLAAKDAGIPIRIGINSGSLKKDVENKTSLTLAEKMVHTAIDYTKMFEDFGFNDIVLSIKSSDVIATINAYRMLAKKVSYPLHLGITESGTLIPGIIKSSIGLGILLHENIGDTIRVSLTADPVEEVRTAFQVLYALKLRQRSIEIISCPTCARCKTNLVKIANDFDKEVSLQGQLFNNLAKPIKVAIMGCEVNGPGEAKHADIGITGGKNTGLLFKNGVPVKKVKPNQWVQELVKELICLCEGMQ